MKFNKGLEISLYWEVDLCKNMNKNPKVKYLILLNSYSVSYNYFRRKVVLIKEHLLKTSVHYQNKISV